MSVIRLLATSELVSTTGRVRLAPLPDCSYSPLSPTTTRATIWLFYMILTSKHIFRLFGIIEIKFSKREREQSYSRYTGIRARDADDQNESKNRTHLVLPKFIDSARARREWAAAARTLERGTTDLRHFLLVDTKRKNADCQTMSHTDFTLRNQRDRPHATQ